MENRINEIEKELTACGKALSRKQLLPELMRLQNQVAEVVFKSEKEETNKSIQNAVKYLASKNNGENEYVNSLFRKCKDDINTISEMIKGIQTGDAGEAKAYKSLETVSKNCKLLRNVELSDGNHRSEIDIVAVTNNGVFLIEVKNTGKNIVIDEKGNYQRETKKGVLVFDKNIGEQMNEKEYLLREVLKKSGINNVKIQSLVVFTNSGITVENKYAYIKECFLSQLPHIVENCIVGARYSDKTLMTITKAIIDARKSDSYPIKTDIKAFKTNIATLITLLENPRLAKKQERKTQQRPRIGFFQRLFRRFARVACALFN